MKNRFAIGKKLPPRPKGPEPRIVALDGTLRDAVHALAAGLELLTCDWPDESDVEWPVYDSGVQLARAVAGVARHTPDGRWDDVPAAQVWAHREKLGSLYEKVESWVLEDPLTALERAASAWWLSRWRSARPLPGDEFARGVREQEFSLVDRPMLGLGDPAMEHLVDEGLLRRIGARQLRMAEGLVASVAGVWTVESRADGRAVFVEPVEGTRLEVREHASMGDNPYGPGYIALGRMIPFGDGTWLRSPGTFLMSYGDRSAELARTLAEGMREQVRHMPVPGFLEATAHTLAGVRGMPRPVLPAPSPDEAAELGRELMLLLREVGAARPADPSSPFAQRMQPGQTEALELALDMVLAEYVPAVFEQSRKSRAVRDAKRRSERKARKKGKGRRR